MAWTVNQEVVDAVTSGRVVMPHEEIRQMFTFEYPVRVRVLKGGPQGMAGKYHGIGIRGPTAETPLESPAHHITLSSGLSAYMANRCLWHELTHAAQCERFLNGGGYEEANRKLAAEFKAEMKEIRRKYGGSPSQLTARYGDVSFEKEAVAAMELGKDIDFITVTDQAHEDALWDNPLVDDEGRYTWRVDLWMAEKWEKGKKVREKVFRGTHYVLAKEEWGARSFAKKEWGDASDESVAYKIFPVRKNKEGE